MGYLLTRESARRAGACYSDNQIEALVPPEGLTVPQVAALPIPVNDRVWAVCHACGVGDRPLRLFAVWCARQALALVPEPDPRSIHACDVAERYALGTATIEEMAAAWDEARGAARGEAWDEAWGAAWAAAWGAARDEAWGAAWAAAWGAQLQKLVEMCAKGE